MSKFIFVVIVQLYKQYWSSGAACPERLVVSAVEPSRRKLRAKAYLLGNAHPLFRDFIAAAV